jgi:hypothetical protein
VLPELSGAAQQARVAKVHHGKELRQAAHMRSAQTVCCDARSKRGWKRCRDLRKYVADAAHLLRVALFVSAARAACAAYLCSISISETQYHAALTVVQHVSSIRQSSTAGTQHHLCMMSSTDGLTSSRWFCMGVPDSSTRLLHGRLSSALHTQVAQGHASAQLQRMYGATRTSAV